MKVSALFALFTLAVASVAGSHLLHEKFAWRELEFSWPSDAVREESLHNGNYIPANNLPLVFDVWRDKAFFTVPRCVWREIISISCLKFMTTFNTINYWQSLSLSLTRTMFFWRWKTGVVSSLNYVELSGDTKTPIFHPYPNFDDNQLSGDKEPKIVSAFGVRGRK